MTAIDALCKAAKGKAFDEAKAEADIRHCVEAYHSGYRATAMTNGQRCLADEALKRIASRKTIAEGKNHMTKMRRHIAKLREDAEGLLDRDHMDTLFFAGGVYEEWPDDDTPGYEAVVKDLSALIRALDHIDIRVPWHPSRAGQERGDGSGWSVAWESAPRVKSVLKRNKRNKSILSWEVPGRNHGPSPKDVKLIDMNGIYVRYSKEVAAQDNELFRERCIEFVAKTAKAGQPITVQKDLTDPQLETLGEMLGWLVDSEHVKDELQRMILEENPPLVYVTGSSTKAAGYYPTAGADDMARRNRKRTNTD